MADWKTQVTYNFNPSYHAYAFVYQAEQHPGNPSGPGPGPNGSGVVDLSGYSNPGAPQAFYAARLGESLSQQRYQDPGLVYVGGAPATHLPRAGPHGGAGTEARRARRSSTSSDTEAHTSPDSWSSVGSREGGLPQTDTSVLAEKDDYLEVIVRSPGGSEDVSSSVSEEPRASPAPPSAPPTDSKTLAVADEPCPKPNGRTIFSQSQMQALCRRFNAQKYLTPSEMKKLAEQVGLTYKQVKTWFQNRRMKLRKHQQDTSWASERSSLYNDASNMASPYPGEGRPQFTEHYHQPTVQAAHRAATPTTQNPAYYAGVGSAVFPRWSPQPAGWSAAPGANHFEYIPNMFASNDFTHGPNLNAKDEDPVSSLNSSRLPNVNL